MSRIAPTEIAELSEAVGEALAAEEPLELVAGGSKRDLGRPLQLPRTLDLSRLAGIRDYQPSELVLTAGAATPIGEIERALASAGQMLAFEPPDWGRLLGLPASVAGRQTLGGVLACNLSGPRRIKAGAARDHFLGFRGVSGRGEVFKAGGKVVKNVTGYDLCKLMAGSYGTLAALEEVTIKVLPEPEATSTVMLFGLEPVDAIQSLNRALSLPHEVSGAAYIPAALTRVFPSLSGVAGVTALRLEGPAPSVQFRHQKLLAEFVPRCEAGAVEGEASTRLWRALRDVAPLVDLGESVVWRISAAPSRGAELVEIITRELDAKWYLDWGGALLWLAVAGTQDGGAALIRTVLRGKDGRGSGHATLIKGSSALRRTIPVFEPQPAGLAALAARVKGGSTLVEF